MKHTVKEESIGAFLRDAMLYPQRKDSASSRDGVYLLRPEHSCGPGIVKEIQIRQDQGVDVGDVVVFEFKENTNVTYSEVNSKLKYNCISYDSISHKLVRE